MFYINSTVSSSEIVMPSDVVPFHICAYVGKCLFNALSCFSEPGLYYFPLACVFHMWKSIQRHEKQLKCWAVFIIDE